MKKFIKFSLMTLLTVSIFCISCKSNTEPEPSKEPETTAKEVDYSIFIDHLLSEDGFSFSKDNIIVTAYYDDNSSKQVYDFTVEPATMTVTEGANQVTFKRGSDTKILHVYKATQALSSDFTKVDDTTYKFGYFAQSKLEDKNGLSFSDNTGRNGWYIGSDGYYYGKAGDDYFKVEPIVWKVFTTTFNHTDNSITGTDVILIPQNVLISGIPYSESTKERTINEKTVYSNNYEYSNLRAFLNGYDLICDDGSSSDKYKVENFLNMAFTSDAQKKILTTVVKNDGLSSTDPNNTGFARIDGARNNGEPTNNPTFSSSDTNDKIFALSIYDYSNSDYGISYYVSEYGRNQSIKRTATEFSKALGIEEDSGYSPYFGRTPYYSSETKTRIVDATGLFYDNDLISNVQVGIVPAITLAAESLQ